MRGINFPGFYQAQEERLCHLEYVEGSKPISSVDNLWLVVHPFFHPLSVPLSGFGGGHRTHESDN